MDRDGAIDGLERVRDEVAACDSEIICAAFEYWDGKRKGRRMPCRGDLDPLCEVPRITPHLALLEVHLRGDRRRFWYRLVGSYTCEVLGSDYTQRYADEVLCGDFLRNVEEYCNAVCDTRLPSLMRLSQPWQTVRTYYRLSMPLSDCGDTVDMLLHALSVVPDNAKFATRLEAIGLKDADSITSSKCMIRQTKPRI